MTPPTSSQPPAPEIVSGDGAVDSIHHIVEDGAWESVLVVCGRHSFEASGAASILPDLKRVAGVERWSDFDANPDSTDLLNGVEFLRTVKPDAVIGIGGGSAMDMAKLLCAYDHLTDQEPLNTAISSGQRIDQRWRAMILAPTTSGTGSEATHFATVYIGEQKFSVAGPALRPDVVVLDPLLTMSATPYQKATSGIDAICQAIESLWATKATPTSQRFARRALRYLLPNIEPFVNDPSPESARAMSTGSHLAGRAIDISRTTAAHALSYPITQRYGVSHGHAVALTLGGFLQAHTTADPDQLHPTVGPAQHTQTMKEVLAYLNATSGTQARNHFTNLMERIGLPSCLPEVGITTRQDRRTLAAAVNPERLHNNPVLFDQARLIALLELVS